MAKMDPQLIVQVLINLTDNAIKYTPAGSSIAVSAQRSGETVRVEVADDGPGIPDAAKEKLFEMFYTAQAKRGDGRRGLGLGLSLCRSIVEAHGGQIGVRDNNPHGTVFWFTLPASDTPSAPPQNGPAVMQKCVFPISLDLERTPYDKLFPARPLWAGMSAHNGVKARKLPVQQEAPYC